MLKDRHYAIPKKEYAIIGVGNMDITRLDIIFICNTLIIKVYKLCYKNNFKNC